MEGGAPTSNQREGLYEGLIRQEEAALGPFFRRYLPKDFKPESVLDFCAGLANEEPVLRNLYGADIRMVSFDSSSEMLELAEQFHLNRKSLIKLTTEATLWRFSGQQFDLLLGRNIPLNPQGNVGWDNRDPSEDKWPDFIQGMKSLISPNGYLLITFPREDEFERGKELLIQYGYRIVEMGQNSLVIPSDKIGVAGADTKDNYVILAKPN